MSQLSASQEYSLLSQILTALGGGSGTYTDKSLSITAGANAQVLAAANSSRKSILVQNPTSEIESIYLNPTGTATAGGDSIELAPGGIATFVTTQAISVLAATTGHKVVAKELA